MHFLSCILKRGGLFERWAFVVFRIHITVGLSESSSVLYSV